jgi:hypothetical protein
MSGPTQAPDWGPISLELPLDAPDDTRPSRPSTGDAVTSIDADFVIVIDSGVDDEEDEDEDGIRRRGNVIEIDLA